MSEEKHSISIFFPFLNDWGTVGSLMALAIATVRKLTADWEVIIINDGSNKKDKEAEIIPSPHALTREEYFAKLDSFKAIPKTEINKLIGKYPTYDSFCQGISFEELDKIHGVTKAEAQEIIDEVKR